MWLSSGDCGGESRQSRLLGLLCSWARLWKSVRCVSGRSGIYLTTVWVILHEDQNQKVLHVFEGQNGASPWLRCLFGAGIQTQSGWKTPRLGFSHASVSTVNKLDFSNHLFEMLVLLDPPEAFGLVSCPSRWLLGWPQCNPFDATTFSNWSFAFFNKDPMVTWFDHFWCF